MVSSCFSKEEGAGSSPQEDIIGSVIDPQHREVKLGSWRMRHKILCGSKQRWINNELTFYSLVNRIDPQALYHCELFQPKNR